MLRKDIQALRAFAVLSVVAFHAGLPGMRRGYLGVDIFFVISGYLIIGMLARELTETGRVRLGPFFARRARRLLPAASLVLAATALLTLWLMPGLQGQRVFDDVEAASVYVANLHFALIQMDYWQPVFLSPVIQYWSLGVEEQFYVLFPLLLALTAIFGKQIKHLSRLLIIELSAIGLASLAFMLHQKHVATAWSFYSPLSRAWEFAIGGLAVLLGAFMTRLEPKLRLAICSVATLGVIGLVVGGSIMDFSTTLSQLLVTVVVAIVLLTGEVAQQTPTWLGRVFSIRPLQWVGDLSYSTYLWHWPVLYFGANFFKSGTFRPDWLTYPQRIILILCTFLCAYVTYRFIENPLRKHPKLVSSPRWSLLMGLILSVGVAALAWSASVLAPSRISSKPIVDVSQARSVTVSNSTEVTNAILELAPSALSSDDTGISHHMLDTAASSLPPTETAHCLAQDAGGALPTHCYFGTASPSSKIVALVGSSHAYQFYSPMLAVANSADARLLLETRAGCALLPGLKFMAEDAGTSSTQACVTWQHKVIANLVETKPAVIVIVTGRSRPVDPLTGFEATSARKLILTTEALAALVKELEPTKSTLVFIRETPMQPYDPIACLSAHTVPACRQPLATSLLPPQMSLPSDSSNGHIVNFDLSLALCDERICPAVRHGMVVWRDRHHITNEYAEALSPLFRELFAPLLQTGTN